MKVTLSQDGHFWQDYTLSEASSPSFNSLTITDRFDQSIKGFGGCFNEMGYDVITRLSPENRARVYNALFAEEGCDFSVCRLPIGANDYSLEWYSHSEVDEDIHQEHFDISRDHRYLIPYIKEALSVNPKILLFASPWSPPIWMKYPKAYNFGTLRWEEPILNAYALYFKKFVEAYAAEGITIGQVHIQNEPRSNQKFPSCLWTGTQMRDFIRNYIGPLFEKEKVPCEIWAGTIEVGTVLGWELSRVGLEDYANWAHTILTDERAYHYTAGIGYQWCGKGAVQSTRTAFPEKPIVQTENECGDGNNSWTYALYVFDLMWHYFVNGTVAYTYWNMILPTGGSSTWGWKQNSMLSVTEDNELVFNPEFYVMKHFAHYVKPGAKRLVTEGHWSSMALAFENTDGSRIVVLANPLKEAKSVGIIISGKRYVIDLPARSLATIF